MSKRLTWNKRNVLAAVLKFSQTANDARRDNNFRDASFYDFALTMHLPMPNSSEIQNYLIARKVIGRGATVLNQQREIKLLRDRNMHRRFAKKRLR